MSAIGQGDGQQAQGENGGEAQQGPNLNSLVEQLGQQGSTLEEMRQFLASQPWQQQAQQEDAPQDQGEIDLSFLDQQEPGYTDPQAVAQQIQQQFDQRMQQELGSRDQQIAELRRDQEARDLAGEFPEIASEEMAQKIAGPNGLAVQMAQQLGQPNLAHEPKFWRMTYLALKATEAHNAQTADNGAAANLESGRGPGPASAPSQEDRIKAIMESGGRGSRVLDFKN